MTGDDGRAGRPATTHGDAVFEADALTHMDHLYAAALRLTRNRASAEDLVQETYLKALRFSSRFTRGTNLRAWLFTILYNTFRNSLRGAVRNPIDVNSDRVDAAELTSSETPETLLLGTVLPDDLRDALEAVPEAYRQAVWLRDVEDFSYAEIAEVLGVPSGTVMSRISRGRRLLYDRLAERRQPESGQPTGE